MLYQRGCRDGLWADNVLGRAFGDVCAHAKAGRLRAAIRCGVGTFLAAGLVGAVGQWLMTKSYMFAPPSIVALVSYLHIVFSVFFWHDFMRLFAKFSAKPWHRPYLNFGDFGERECGEKAVIKLKFTF